MLCCLNPDCEKPLNPDNHKHCQHCGLRLVSLLSDRFRILRPLDRGGFGKIYLAEDTHNHHQCCVVKQLAYQSQGTWAIQRAEELFLASNEGLRNKLLEYVLSNIESDDKKLSYELNDPFKTIVETKKKALSGSNSNIWCDIPDAFLTAVRSAEDDYKLQGLVKEFGLSGNLIGSEVAV